MFELVPISDRVSKIRAKYRSTVPHLCIARLKIATEFYQNNRKLTGPLKRARLFKTICEQIPITIFEDEVIVGTQVTSYRASSLNPEFGGLEWFRRDWESGALQNRKTDYYILDPDDVAYVLSTVDFWEEENCSARLGEYLPEGYLEAAGNGVTTFKTYNLCAAPIGHFCANYQKLIHRGFRSIYEEAKENMAALEGHMFGEEAQKYSFYRSVAIVMEGMMILTQRYSDKCAEMAETETNPERKAELLSMAECLHHISTEPCRTYHDAVQCIFIYHIGMCLDGQQHGISFGRIDQYLGEYYERDIANGAITPERAQELLDLFYLKCAEMNKMGGGTASGYTSGMLMTLGGVDEYGNDATNPVTYMMLQSAARLVLHDPPQALRIHKNTPPELWEAALATTMRAGGVPTFENDEVIIPALRKRGMDLKSARGYCLIGCVEPSGTGNHWCMCGGTGLEGYWNMANCYLLAINNGINPMPYAGENAGKSVGIPTGYLYDMESFDELLEAVRKQMKYFVDWQISLNNLQQVITARELPLPLVSATMDGCMESGKDVMDGGCLNNSTGFPGIAIGNLVDSLAITKYLVFDKKICTGRELYDALMANWEGYEELHDMIMNRVPRYGNANQYSDSLLRWVSENFADFVSQGTDPRGGKYYAGLFPVAFNVLYGLSTAATPDGRYAKQPLSDGISPMQGIDRNGPTAVMESILRNLDQEKYPDGTLMNLKLHPTAFANELGIKKVTALMQTYFLRGGMELQLNVISTDTLKKAKETPEEYQDLVVRVAGFSAYFVELTEGSQNDVISRTEINL